MKRTRISVLLVMGLAIAVMRTTRERGGLYAKPTDGICQTVYCLLDGQTWFSRRSISLIDHVCPITAAVSVVHLWAGVKSPRDVRANAASRLYKQYARFVVAFHFVAPFVPRLS